MNAAPRKIVVVDDTPEILDLIEAVLTDEGYEVLLCQEPPRAVEVIAAERPALVVLDLRMEGVGEWELVERLKSEPALAEIPIIVCSGAVDALRAAAPRLRAQGCDILVKPFDIDELVAKVDALLGGV